MRSTAFAVLALSATAALASEPGQPLDCSDWVFLEPGLRCVPYSTSDADCGGSRLCTGGGRSVVDAGSGVLFLRWTSTGACGGWTMGRVELVRSMMGVEAVVAYVATRCNGLFLNADRTGGPEEMGGELVLHPFDASRGRVIFPLYRDCRITGMGGSCDYGSHTWLATIEGFPTTFDVLQTFTPSASAVGFRVPYMPEGLVAADHFDTYYGPLTKPIDFGSAQPLACDYPAAAPGVGEYLEVPATLPDPPAGQGYWYLTSVTYQGQTRYGRKASGGRLSGREPGGVGACDLPR